MRIVGGGTEAPAPRHLTNLRRGDGSFVLRRGRRAAAAALVVAAIAGCGGGSEPTVPPRCAAQPLADGAGFEEHTVFQGGLFGGSPDGYPVFRIPSIVSTSSGVLLAFSEARQSLADPGAGKIDLVMKQSLDCGRSWSEAGVLADNGSGDAHNPAAVVVPGRGSASRVWLFYNQRPASPGGEADLPPGLGADSASIWLRTSDDDGASWSEPRELTREVKDPAWAIASMGPGLAIVTRTGSAAGRIVVPGWYTRDGHEGSFAFASDDGGKTFARLALPEPTTNESQLVELSDRTLVLDGRQNSGLGLERRQLFASQDGGATWSAPTAGLAMVPIMSSVLRYSARRDGDAADLLLHSGVSTLTRIGARVWASGDEGASWDHETVIEPGFAQYSVLTVLDDGTIGMLYESVGGSGGAVGFDIRLARFAPAFLGL